jgi:hypothetical protein
MLEEACMSILDGCRLDPLEVGNKRAVSQYTDETMRGNMFGGYSKFDAQTAIKCSDVLVFSDKNLLVRRPNCSRFAFGPSLDYEYVLIPSVLSRSGCLPGTK